jgi:uroporphyrinogen decarboxylase
LFIVFSYVFAAITLTRHALQDTVPFIGFTGAPFTLFCYAVEGSSSKTWAKAIRMMYVHSDFSHKIFDLLTETNINYLVAQVKAGAQVSIIYS